MKRWLTILLIFCVGQALALTNGFNKPFMGWNDVDYWWQNVSAQCVSNAAQAFHTNGLQSAGYNYICIDAYWSDGTTNELGVPNPDPVRFPDGMKPVADYVHSLGLKFGLYFQCDYYGHNGLTEMSAPYWTNVVNQFAAWGVDYVMADFLDTISYGGTTIDAQDLSRIVSGAVMGCGRSMIFAVDYSPVQSWTSTWCNYGRTSQDPNGTWERVLGAMDDYHTQASSYATLGFWPDPSLLQIETLNSTTTSNECRSQFALWCVMGANLSLSHNGTNLSQASFDLVTNPELIAIDQDELCQPGLRKSRVVGYGGNLDVWGKPVTNGVAVACFNGSDGTTNISFSFTTCGFSNGTAFVRDAFARSNVGTVTDSYTVSNLTSHDTAVFVLMTNRETVNWYVDCNATNGLNSGTSWANAWTNFGTHLQGGSVVAGDTVYVSGGQYPEQVVIDQGGTSNAPITIRASREAGHNSLVWIGELKFYGSADWITVDGSKDSSVEATITNVLNLRLRSITNNLGIRIGEIGNTNGECILSSSGNAGLKLRWLEVRQNSQSTNEAYAVSLHRDTGITYAGGEIAYCWVHQCCGTAINMNSGGASNVWGAFQIHHTLIEDYGDAGIDMGGSVDVHHCIIGKNWCVNGHPGQFRLGNPCRIYNCLLYDTYAGDPVMYTSPQRPLTGQTLFYGNVIYNELEWGATNAGGTAIGMAVNEVVFNAAGERNAADAMPQTWTNVYTFNNTIICSNGLLNGLVTWNRKGPLPDELEAPTGGVYVAEARTFNNIIDGGWIKWRGPSKWGWYDGTSNQVNFNALVGIDYSDTNYTPSQFAAAYPTMASNTATIPTFADRSTYDFRLLSQFPGTNLSSFTNVCPGLDVDLSGVARGNGAWDVGALAYRSISSITDATLILRYTFSDLSTNGTTDVSGHSNSVVTFYTNWPTRVSYTNGTGYAGQFMRTAEKWSDDFYRGSFGAITNVSDFADLKAITVSVWAKYFEYDYGYGTLVEVMSGTNGCTWYLGRNGAQQTSFGIRTNLDWNTDGSLHCNFLDNQSLEWHHYAVTFDVTNKVIRDYLDGTNCSSADLSSKCSYLTNLTVGNLSYYGRADPGGTGGWIAVGCLTHESGINMSPNNFPNHGWFSGQMYDLQIYNRALSATEIQAIYTGTNVPAPPTTNNTAVLGVILFGGRPVTSVTETNRP